MFFGCCKNVAPKCSSVLPAPDKVPVPYHRLGNNLPNLLSYQLKPKGLFELRESTKILPATCRIFQGFSSSHESKKASVSSHGTSLRSLRAVSNPRVTTKYLSSLQGGAQLIPRKCWEPLPRHIEIDMLTSARSGAGEEGCQQAKDIHAEAMTMRHADDFGLAKALKANTTVSIAEISPVMRGTYK